MPGFGLLFDRGSGGEAPAGPFERALEAVRHDDRYRPHIVAAGPMAQLGWTAYGGYPIRAWQSEHLMAVLEGMVYDRDWDDLLSRLADVEAGRQPSEDVSRIIHDWVNEADGDFAVVVITGTPAHGVIVGIDALGRLPVYWCRDGTRLLVSREVKFITSLLSTVQPDRTGIAQMLSMGFPWEERTLIEGVHRLPPGAVLSWHEGGGDAPELKAHRWSFHYGPAEGAMTAFTGELVDRFLAATRERVKACSDRPQVLSLSGGMDSRAVAAALQRLNADAHARTFSLPGYQSPREVESARSIALLCDLPWRVVPLSPPSAETCDRLVFLKDGLNSAAMAYADEYLSALVMEHRSNAVLFSGGGGDLALVPRHPERTLRSSLELADLLLSRNMVFHPALLVDSVGVTRSRLCEELAAVLDSYPEPDMAEKYLHFCFAGYEFKSYFEGEDRNRGYLWTTAPFYARPLFERAMQAPFSWKRRRRLSREFLRQLNPHVARVRNANTGLVPFSPRDLWRQWSRERVLSHASWERTVRSWRRRHAGRGPFPPIPQAQLLETIKSSPLVGEVFRRDRLLAWAENPPHAGQLWPLYTVVRYLQLLD